MAQHSQMSLDDTIKNLRYAVNLKEPKTKQILINSLYDYANMLKREDSFDPTYNIRYERGYVVTVDLGYNAKNEEGGRRPCVVLDHNNDKSNGTVMVTPLSSLPPGVKTEDVKLRKGEILLGEIKEYNQLRGQTGVLTKALIHQTRAISKMRIVAPTKSHHVSSTAILPEESLQNIKQEFLRLFL